MERIHENYACENLLPCTCVVRIRISSVIIGLVRRAGCVGD